MLSSHVASSYQIGQDGQQHFHHRTEFWWWLLLWNTLQERGSKNDLRVIDCLHEQHRLALTWGHPFSRCWGMRRVGSYSERGDIQWCGNRIGLGSRDS